MYEMGMQHQNLACFVKSQESRAFLREMKYFGGNAVFRNIHVIEGTKYLSSEIQFSLKYFLLIFIPLHSMGYIHEGGGGGL